MDEEDVRRIVHDEMTHFLTDIEYRLRQIYAREEGNGQVYAEDLSINSHLLTGYTVTANSPAAGRIAWTNVHIVYGGVDYQISNGNTSTTAGYYCWLDISTAIPTGNPTLKTAALNVRTQAEGKPPLETGDVIVFLNNAGTPVSLLQQNLPMVLGDNSVDTAALQPLAVTGAKITNATIGALQLGAGAITPGKLSIIDHTIY